MKDGHLNKCKVCVINYVQGYYREKIKNPEYVEKQRARCRDKYHRLNYKTKQNQTTEQKREVMNRYKAKYPEKAKAKNYTHNINCKKGNNLHHWSYNEKHLKDVIELSIADHNLIHRHMTYDQEYFMYRNSDGMLLSTKIKHKNYIDKILNYYKEKNLSYVIQQLH